MNQSGDSGNSTNRPGTQSQKPWWVGLLAVALAIASYYAKQKGGAQNNSPPANSAPQSFPSSPAQTPQQNDDRSARPATDHLAELIAAHQTDPTEVESSGRVVKVLPDDTEGEQHAKFLVRIASGDTILIAHNIDLASRPPVEQGMTVRFKGEFIWNDRGGVVHWTHKDPRHHHADGWLELNGKRYD